MKYPIAFALSLALGMGVAFAQTTTPTPAPAPAASSVQSTAPVNKKAISKSCTDQANAKALHGKARKKFRSECKKNGGKAF